MGSPLLKDWLVGDSQETLDLVENEESLKGFLSLAQEVNDLPDMDIHFYDSPPNLYQVISTGHASTPITPKVTEFFGEPVKIAGKTVPLSLRFDPVMQYVGGIRKDQSLFLKKLKTGSFFCVLWTWPGRSKNTEIRLGWCFPEIQAEDYTRLCRMMENFLLQKNAETLSGIGGTIHGISLPSFLQMSEMEEATYTLRVTSGEHRGSLYLSGGNLIDALYGDTIGNAAAYQIISWENATIQIEAADPDRVRRIHEPLMYIMMESMKIKDEGGAEVSASPPAAPVHPPDPPSVPKPDQPEPSPASPRAASDPEDRFVAEEPEDTDLPSHAPSLDDDDDDDDDDDVDVDDDLFFEIPDPAESPPENAPEKVDQNADFSGEEPEEAVGLASLAISLDTALRDSLVGDAPDDALDDAPPLSPAVPAGSGDHGGPLPSEAADLSSLVAAMVFEDPEGASPETQSQDASSVPPDGPSDPPPLFDGSTFSALSVDALEAISAQTGEPSSDVSWMPPLTPDASAKKKRSGMRPMIKWLIGVACVIVLGVAITGGVMVVRERQAADRYNRLMTDLAITKALDAKIVLLTTYLQDYPNDSHRPMLEARIKSVTREMEDAAYREMVAEVAALPLDEQYENKALSLYAAFLTQYPKTRHMDEIDAAKAGLRATLEKFYFETLKKPADGDRTDFVAQYLACKAYVDRFPDSKYRNEVDNMMKAVAADYANILKKQAAVCDKQGKWDDCIAGLDQYLTHLSDTPEAEQIRKLHAGMVDQKELFDLDAKAAAISHDWAKALKLYTDYRDKRPDTTQLAALNKRINRLDVQAQDLAKWKDISAYASKPTHLITERVKRLEDYIKGAPEPYATQARQLRAKLEPALQQYRRDQKQAERDAAARQQQLAYEAFLAREKQRIARLQETASRKLKPVASRFRDNGNGTVTDLRTGLTWTLLDSTMEMEKGGYMDHRSAQAYVAILSTGGYSWRLPTASELATLYKNKPFFPETGAGWYWTSETFAKGFSYVVDVITTKPETVFYRIPKDEKELGAVRAVRR